jgi:hypothetical protein
MLAVVAHLAITLPARQAALAAGDEHARLRADRREAMRRLAQVEKRAALLARVGAGSSESDREGAVHEVRAHVVEALRDAGVGRVRLEVRPVSKGPALAGIRLQADGRFFDLVRLLSLLGRSGSTLVLQQLNLSHRGSEIGLTVEAQAFGEAP